MGNGEMGDGEVDRHPTYSSRDTVRVRDRVGVRVRIKIILLLFLSSSTI